MLLYSTVVNLCDNELVNLCGVTFFQLHMF